MKTRLKQRDIREHGTVVARLDAVVRPRGPDLVPIRRPVPIHVSNVMRPHTSPPSRNFDLPLLRAVPKHEVDALILRRIAGLHEARPRREVACDVLPGRLALQVEHLEVRQRVIWHRILGRERRVHRYGRNLARDDLVRARVAARALAVEVSSDDDRAACLVRLVAGTYEHERRGQAALAVGQVVEVRVKVGEADLTTRAALEDEIGGRADAYSVCTWVLGGLKWRIPETLTARKPLKHPLSK